MNRVHLLAHTYHHHHHQHQQAIARNLSPLHLWRQPRHPPPPNAAIPEHLPCLLMGWQKTSLRDVQRLRLSVKKATSRAARSLDARSTLRIRPKICWALCGVMGVSRMLSRHAPRNPSEAMIRAVARRRDCRELYVWETACHLVYYSRPSAYLSIIGRIRARVEQGCWCNRALFMTHGRICVWTK